MKKRSFWEKLKGFFNRRDLSYYNDEEIEVLYLNAGALLGETIYDTWPDAPQRLEPLVEAWERWERAYAGRGYRTLSLDAFIAIGAMDHNPKAFGLTTRRRLGEPPVFHAPYFRQRYLKYTCHEPFSVHELLHEPSHLEDLPSTAHLEQQVA
jgi:hypothetical protein